VVGVKVDAFIGRSKVTEIRAPGETLVAPAAGDWLTIAGWAGREVVKVQVEVLPKALPSVSVTVPGTVTV
jgi:hypothetical protein